MKIIKKMLIAVILVSCIMALYNMYYNKVNALSDFESQANDFINAGKQSSTKIDTTSITNEFKKIGQILSYIGAGVMVAVTAYLGVQYIISPPDKQGALKEKLIGLVVSGIVIFGAYAIWKLVIGIVSSF